MPPFLCPPLSALLSPPAPAAAPAPGAAAGGLADAGFALLLAEEAGGGLAFFAPILIVFVIFYLLVFRPASRERKAREQQVKSLKKHDAVVTNAGIHGTVVALDEATVTLRVDDKTNTRIRFSRAAVWQVNPEGATTEAPPGAEDAPGAATR